MVKNPLHFMNMTGVKLFISAFVALFIHAQTLFAAELHTEHWKNKNYIQDAFNEIALKNEYRQTEQRVLKWEEPIRYQFIYRDMPKNKMIENLFKTHLSHLEKITGHSIRHHNPNKRATQPNLSIYLSSDTSYGNVIKSVTGSNVKQIERKSHCMATYKSDRQNTIVEATIVIPVDHVFSRGLLVTCIVEEATQILGLPNDSDWVNPSIANDSSKIELLTGLDYLLLKILYDKSLKAGMPYPQNQKVIKKIIQKLEHNGQIGLATEIVNRRGLYRLLN